MSQKLRVAFQMDPMENINIEGDSTFVLALEAQDRGHRLWHYLPQNLSYREGRVVAEARPLVVRREKGNHFTLGAAETLDLEQDLDVIMMRQDPPFDMSYIAATHLLDLVHPRTLVVNDPSHVRNAPEKLFTLLFRDLMPETLITRSLAEIKAFRARHKEIVLKPLFGKGGEGVFHLDETDSNLASLLELFSMQSREPIMVQRFLSEVRGGDKRIILVNGEPAGAVNRVPAKGEVRSNLVVGGRAEKSTLTDRELAICRTIGPELKKRGLIFVGIDVIGGWLTEINVTSPTGLQSINGFDGVRLESDIWDAVESTLA